LIQPASGPVGIYSMLVAHSSRDSLISRFLAFI
jgi:hypothetical protein